MNFEELMEMMSDKDEGSDRPDIARFSTDERRARELKQQQDFMDLIEKTPLPQASGLRVVRGLKGARGGKKLLGKPGERKPTVPRSERKMKDGFKSVGAEEFHDLLGKVESLDVEQKSLASIKNILKSGGKLFRGVGEYEDAIYGISPGGTENELFGVNVPKKLRGRGAGTEIIKDSKRRNLEIPGHKPLVGYAIQQTPEEGSYLDRFYTTGGRGRRTQTYKYDPTLANPERRKAGYETSDVGRYQHSGIYSKDEEKMPENWEQYIGDLSKIEQVGEGQIPGGLDGKFSHADLYWLRSNPLDLKLLNTEQIDRLYEKQARTMTRDVNDPYERQNVFAFGQLSGNSDLDTSELALSRLRMTDVNTVNRLASYIPKGKKWKDLTINTYKKGPDGKYLMEPNPNKPEKMRKVLDVQGERSEISNRIIGDYNLQGRDKGGLGLASSLDFSAIAELARLLKENPDFHKQAVGVGDKEHIEVLMNQIPGISQKTGSLAMLLMKPMESKLGALDRHIVRNLDLKPSGIATTAGYKPTPTYPTHKDSPRVPQHIKGLDVSQLKSPKGDVQWMSPEYNRGLNLLSESAKDKPFGPGMEQWRRWDVDERGFFSPHEYMYPGIQNYPRMPDHRVASVRDTLAKAKYWSKTDPDKPYQFQPEKIPNWKDSVVWGALPVNKILNPFKPREPWQQARKGTGYHTMRYGAGS